MEREIKKIVDRVLFEEINKAGLRIKNRIERQAVERLPVFFLFFF